jgi:hypothetical protein
MLHVSLLPAAALLPYVSYVCVATAYIFGD